MMTQQEFAKRFALLAPLLCKNHYCITPIKPNTKLPLLSHWQDKPYTYQNLPLPNAYEDHGVGILCGIGDVPIVALDIDAPNKALSDAMKTWCIQTLGAAPERVGRAPKTLLIYRADAPGWKKIKSAVFYDKDHNKNQLEILGLGQQFVAFGKHPDTGKDFEWSQKSPIDKPAYELTIISAEKLQLAIEYFEGLASEMGLNKASDSKIKTSILFAAGPDAQSDALDFMKSIPAQRLGMTYEQAKEALTFIKDNEDYDTWCAVGMALHYEFEGSDEAFDLWDEWSSTASNYSEYEGLQHKWSTFNRSGGDVLTGFWLRKRAQEGGLPVVVKRAYDATGLADRFVDMFKNKLLYAVDTGVWHEWTGYRWADMAHVDFVTKAQQNAYALEEELSALKNEDERKQLLKLIAYSRRPNMADDMYKIVRGREEFKIKTTIFDTKFDLIGVNIGAIDRRTGEILSPDSKSFIKHIANEVYVPGSSRPKFEKLIADVCDNNQRLMRYLQKSIGYSLSGDPNLQVLFIVYGSSGNNGKSTVFNAILDALGNYAGTTDISTLLTDNNNRSNDKSLNLLDLMGKRLVVAAEPDSWVRMRESLIKSMTGGDQLHCRPLFQSKIIKFKPTWVSYILTNHMPYISYKDTALCRRIKVIPFERNLKEAKDITINDNLANELKEEKSGILDWVIEGYQLYLKEGLQDIPEVIEITQRLFKEADPLVDFFEAFCDIGPQYSVSNPDLFKAAKLYEEQNGKLNLFSNTYVMHKQITKDPKFTAGKNIKGSDGRRHRGILGLRVKPGILYSNSDFEDIAQEQEDLIKGDIS